LILELEDLARDSASAAASDASEAELAAAYVGLRGKAATLNARHAWMTPEDLANELPTVQALDTIEALDRAFGVQLRPSPPPHRGKRARLIQALVELSGWGTGARPAYETLREMDGD
jgi:hypothetical protein